MKEKTCAEIATSLQPTIGDVVLTLAQELAHIAVARAIQSRDWTEHPMFGIAVDSDQWAISYQLKLEELRKLLTHNAIANLPDWARREL